MVLPERFQQQANPSRRHLQVDRERLSGVELGRRIDARASLDQLVDFLRISGEYQAGTVC